MTHFLLDEKVKIGVKQVLALPVGTFLGLPKDINGRLMTL